MNGPRPDTTLVNIKKTFVGLLIILLLSSISFFAASANAHMNAKNVVAHELDEIPNEFIVLSEKELGEYNELKEAMDDETWIRTSPGKWERTYQFLTNKGSFIVKYEDQYYQISFDTA